MGKGKTEKKHTEIKGSDKQNTDGSREERGGDQASDITKDGGNRAKDGSNRTKDVGNRTKDGGNRTKDGGNRTRGGDRRRGGYRSRGGHQTRGGGSDHGKAVSGKTSVNDTAGTQGVNGTASENQETHEVNGSDNGNQLDNIETRKYAKRKIESNWSRYDEPIIVDEQLEVEEEYDETKDFEYIRQHSASASSHFKFKEEKEWEDQLQKSEEKGILGLNLVAIANDLQQCDVVETLRLEALLQEECMYCIKDVYQPKSRTSEDPSSLHPEPINSYENITWSYNGIENYKYLVGLISEKEQVEIYEKSRMSQNTTHDATKNRNVKDIFSKVSMSSEPTDVTPHSDINGKFRENTVDCLTSLASNDDDDILDELLMDKCLFHDSSEWLNDSKDDSKDDGLLNASLDESLSSQANNLNISGNRALNTSLTADAMNASAELEISCSDVDELDLDMLLECDASETNDPNVSDNEVDADLDQWLDDMLT